MNAQSCDLLVLDAESEFRETVARRYSRRGFLVHQWDPSGNTQATSLPSVQIDVVLIRLSADSHASFAELLRQGIVSSTTQLLVLTGRETFETGIESLPSATNDVLLRPLIWTELDWRIQKARERAQQSKEIARWRTASHRIAIADADSSTLVTNEGGAFVPMDASGREMTGMAKLDSLARVQRAHILEVLQREGWNKARSARALGVNRRSLYRLIEKFQIKVAMDETSTSATPSDNPEAR